MSLYYFTINNISLKNTRTHVRTHTRKFLMKILIKRQVHYYYHKCIKRERTLITTQVRETILMSMQNKMRKLVENTYYTRTLSLNRSESEGIRMLIFVLQKDK